MRVMVRSIMLSFFSLRYLAAQLPARSRRCSRHRPIHRPSHRQRLGVATMAGLAIMAMGAVSVTGANPAIANGIVTAPRRSDLTTAGMSFKQAMNLGYAASRQGDLHTALINFQRALLIQPGNPYAAAAADNMAYYIQYERISSRQQAIDRLQARLVTATEQKDWVCAATTLDQLTTYTQPNSLERERLIGRRGEVSGLLDARIDHESWSTVCAAQGPVY